MKCTETQRSGDFLCSYCTVSAMNVSQQVLIGSAPPESRANAGAAIAESR